MNLSKYREKNLVHARGLFLSFCTSYIIGDIVWVSGGWDFFIFLVFLIFISLWKRWILIGIIAIVGYLLWYGYGAYSYANTRATLDSLASSWYIYDVKNRYIWTIEKRLYSKERSEVYRLNIDNIDTTSTWEISIPEKEITIFVELPSNIRTEPGDVIWFTGKIQKNITYPIEWYEKYTLYQGWYGYIFLTGFERIVESNESTIIWNVKDFWGKIFLEWFPSNVSGILLGMTIGADEYMEKDIKKSFTESGISHILVVSGANIAFLILFMTFFMKYLPIGKYIRIVIIGGIILFYGTLVGWDVSVVRATIMGIISYLIAEYGARTSSLATLALAGLVLTIYNPLSPIYDAGFGLSFGATLGILIFHTPIQKYWIRAHLPENIYPFVSVSIWAMLGSAPILIYHFSTFPVGTLIINILISIVLWWILFGSVFYVLFSLLSSHLAYYFGFLLYIPARYIIELSALFDDFWTITLSENTSKMIALILLGSYTVLLLEKDIIFRDEQLRE